MLDIFNFINGKDQPSSDEQYLYSFNPANEAVIAKVNIASKADVDSAVAAARAAYDTGPWPSMSVEQRAYYLHAIADALEANIETFAQYECEDTGFTETMCLHGHLPRAIEHFRYFAEESKRMLGQTFPIEQAYINFTNQVPLGVVAIITPWNGPLAVSSINLAAALACGNTCVLKPSEMAPVTVSLMSQIFAKVGLPEGVINIIHGPAEPTGKALIENNDIDAVCFVGGSVVGKQVLRNSAENLRRCTLELGGKSPTVVLADADIEVALDGALTAALSSNGQVCTSGSRVIVEQPLYDTFVERFVERVSNVKIGPPTEASTQIGPMISEGHRQGILDTIETAISQGYTLRYGGKIPTHLNQGFYLEPAIFVDVDNSSELAQEEIFGPVICLIKADDAEHAVALANQTKYGLAASIYSASQAKALAYAKQIRAGNVGVNTPFIRDIRCPFGGFKQSGLGAVGGQWSLSQYTNTQTLSIPLNGYDLPRYGLKDQ